MTRTGFYASLGFVLWVLCLFLWTVFGGVWWLILGGIALMLCFLRCERY